jgi:hypothetical protein
VQSPATRRFAGHRAQGFERRFVLPWRRHKAGEQQQGVDLADFGERYGGTAKPLDEVTGRLHRCNRERIVILSLHGIGEFEGRLHAQRKELEAGVSTMETCGMRSSETMS